jgi:hypothetical protein
LGYFTENDLLLTIAKQTAINTVPGAASAIVIPIAKGSQGPEHTRNKIENDARYADGYSREFVLGNHNSGADMPWVSNLDVFGYGLAGLCGGLADGTTTDGITPHTGKPTKTASLYTIEESVGGIFYQYVDQVFSELDIQYEQEGLFRPTFKTVGSGKLVKAGASMDATPTEVVGAPAEMLNWSTLTDGVDEGVVQTCSLNVKREVIPARAGNAGIARDMKVGSITVTGTVTVLFTGDTLYEKARNGVKLSFDLGITRADRAFNALMPETKLEPKGLKKQSGQLITQEFAFESVVASNANSPIFFTLANGIASHNNT